MFDKLLNMVQTYYHSYFRMLLRNGYSKNSHGKIIYNEKFDRRELFNWINSNTPKLQDDFLFNINKMLLDTKWINRFSKMLALSQTRLFY